MERKRNRKGFTLAELLIVVAIIAVLVAIAIPVFTRQLERSRESTDLSNIRSAYGELVTQYLADGSANSATVTLKQQEASWNYVSPVIGTSITVNRGSGAGEISITGNPTAGGTATLAITQAGSVTISCP